jgi:dGTPase
VLFYRNVLLSPFAVDQRGHAGPAGPEPASPTRTDFQRDRDRIIHSTAFRRLKHKTQVFVEHEGDHFRTRLTHTIEVAQIARAIARALALDEDLARRWRWRMIWATRRSAMPARMCWTPAWRSYGGFDHNAQALRIVTRLERRYAAHDGLNLTWETLEGLVKHNGPLLDADPAIPTEKYREPAVPGAILEFDRELHPLDLPSFASAEAQSRRSPMISPITPMTSTTACGPGCSR